MMRVLHILFSTLLIFGYGVNDAISACPLGCYCQSKFADCSTLMDFPHDLDKDTERIHVSHMNIEEIPKMAFSYLPNITLIEFEQSNIGRLGGCAFMNMFSIKKIIFNKVVIGSIDSFAFSNLKNLERIEFLETRIGRLKSFALYQLTGLSVLTVVQSNIEFVYPNAFTELQNVSTIRLTSNNISDVVTSVFRDVNANKIEITTNTFWNVHCGVLEEMSRSYTGKFVFNFNSFYCNCSIANMLGKHGREVFQSILSENTCHGPKELVSVASLAAVDLDWLKCKTPATDDPEKCQPIREKLVDPTCSGPSAGRGNGQFALKEDGPGGRACSVYYDVILLGLALFMALTFMKEDTVV